MWSTSRCQDSENGKWRSACDASKKPNCPFDLGYRVSIACRMAVESYRQQRSVTWDPVKEEIV